MTDSVTARPANNTVSDTELLATLFELGREVTSVLEVNELFEKIPQLIARLTTFSVFAVYLLDERRGELKIAYAVGYPEDLVDKFTLKVGEGLVGTAVAEQRPILVNDVSSDPRYVTVVPGAGSDLVVPLATKARSWARSTCCQSRRTRFRNATRPSFGSLRPTWRRPLSTPTCSSRSANTPRRSRPSPRSAGK